MLGTWQLELSLQITLVAVPVAVYFLILGLLNSQTRPQVLTGQLDFAMLAAALSPLFLVPILAWVGPTLWSVLAAGLGVAGVIYLAGPKAGTSWVIYNISKKQALRAVEKALDQAGLAYEVREDQIHFPDGAVLRLSAFPMLRNVSLTFTNANADICNKLSEFSGELRRQSGHFETFASPMAVSFVLISTAMIVAPIALMANRMPEMVRLISDMIG